MTALFTQESDVMAGDDVPVVNSQTTTGEAFMSRPEIADDGYRAPPLSSTVDTMTGSVNSNSNSTLVSLIS